MKALKVGFLSSGDATFPRPAKILRYVNIVAQPQPFRVSGTVEAGSRLCPPPYDAEATKACASCASPSRFSCAGVIQTPVPLWVAKRIQSPPKSVASIGIPCKMRSADLASGYRYFSVTTTQRLSIIATTQKKEHPTLCSLKLKT